MSEIKNLPSYKVWREAWRTEKVFTREDMANAKNQIRAEFERALSIQGIQRALPNGDIHALTIASVKYLPEGIWIVVR